MEEFFTGGLGLPAYRVVQLIHRLYEKKVRHIEELREFSKDLRRVLEEKASISWLDLLDRSVSTDGTRKYLFGLEDGQAVESVLIPGEERLTLCISSQAGCAMGCRFCLTGAVGFKRNLKAYEIVDQVLWVERECKDAQREVETGQDCGPESDTKIPSSRLAPSEKIITNIVLMGMGEPLENFDEVVEALYRITKWLGYSKRRITLSTCGITPAMKRLYEAAPEVNLAVSLNATTDGQRSRLMPVNRKYPLAGLIEACRSLPLSPRRRITFEYILISGVNDSQEDAIRLTRLLRGIKCKVNLIAFNEYEGAAFHAPSEEEILRFQQILIDRHITAFIRKSKGRDILAACGQLKASYGCLPGRTSAGETGGAGVLIG